LLERQFVVPTLESKPTEDTLNWEDGEYLVDFRIGELCRVRENEEWVFYRLQDIAEGMAYWSKANASELPDMSDYYTKDETNKKIEDSVSSIVIPEDESIKNVTQDEYDAMKEANTLSDKTLYFVSKDDSPVALYIGKVQIAVREEGSKGFAYNFPIIF
jgi:hypothetical protein